MDRTQHRIQHHMSSQPLADSKARAVSMAPFRKLTPGILASARLAAQPAADTTKSQASIIIKRACPALGIDGTAYHILDILIGLTGADDWSGARRPVAVISNARLADYAQRSERTIIRALRKLVEAGLAAYRDSPTGRRFARAEAGGREAYGLDFTPARVRLGELRQMADAYRDALDRQRETRAARTRLSRAIADIAASLAGSDPAAAEALTARLAQTLDATQDAQDAREGLHALEALYADALEGGAEQSRANLAPPVQLSSVQICPVQVTMPAPVWNPTERPPTEQAVADEASQIGPEAACVPAFDSDKESGAGDIRVTPIISTESPQDPLYTGAVHSGPKADFLKIDKGNGYERHAHSLTPSCRAASHASASRRDALSHVPIGLIAAACGETMRMLRLSFGSWPALVAAIEPMARIVGIRSEVLGQALHACDRRLVAAIVAVVAEKALRGEAVRNPCGYFSAMVQRAREGGLNLHRSLLGLCAPGFLQAGEGAEQGFSA